MNTIPSIIPLIVGIASITLFVGVFIASWIITMRNRRIIRDRITPP